MIATISTLKKESDRQKIKTPAIIVVGKVCTLSEDFAWYEKLPLAGWKILVTRPRENISRTAAKLREKGAEVLELPSISISPLEDQSRLQEAFAKLNTYDWLVFTSPAGVEVFFRQPSARAPKRSFWKEASTQISCHLFMTATPWAKSLPAF